MERGRARAGHNVLGEDIQPARAERFSVQYIFGNRIKCCARFKIFEAIARNDHRFAGRIKPVVGPPDPLEQA